MNLYMYTSVAVEQGTRVQRGDIRRGVGDSQQTPGTAENAVNVGGKNVNMLED